MHILIKPAVLTLTLFASIAFAQSWPTKPVKLVVGFPAGGPADSVARALGNAASPNLGQPVVIDNRAGALATIGSEAVARSPADGYTALLGFAAGHALTPAIMNLRFDPIKDLPSIVGVARSELVLVTGGKNKGMTLQDFIRKAKASGDKTNVGAIGTGSINHLTGELFKRAAGFTSQHIPYPGAAPLALAVIAGEVDLAVIDMGGVLAHVTAGNLVPLAVASAKRSEFLPNVPTTGESGFPKVLSENIYGVFLPVGVPQGVQTRMQAALTTAVGSAPFQDQMRKAGLVPQLISHTELDALIKSQSEQFVPIARDLKIRVE